MMYRKLRSLLRDQRGLTLVELLIAIVLVGIVTAGITITIGHMFTWTTSTNNHMTAVRQVQSAGYWVSRDALQAQQWVISDSDSTDPDEYPLDSGFPFTMEWQWEGKTTEVTYSITGDKRLQRTRIVIENDVVTEVSSYVAQHIDFSGTSIEESLSFEGRKVLALQVMATVVEQSETRAYDITPRPDA